MNIRIISAGAGSGKTYRLTQELVQFLREGVRAGGIIATTFTQKAAAELHERVRVRLLEEGLTRQADELTNALIGTVHGLGVKLLKRFAYEAGVSPEVDIIADEDQQVLFNQSLATVLTEEHVERMEALSARLGLQGDYFDWRREVRTLTEVARANDFSEAVLEQSKLRSFDSFRAFLGEVSERTEEQFNQDLARLLDETIRRLEQNDDGTKTTQTAVSTLRGLARELELRGWLSWPDWARVSKVKVGAKSRDDAADLIDFAARHDSNPAFQRDIRDFIYLVFELALAAIREYDAYKKRRGLIDYTDMEVLVKRLLDQPAVREVLAGEIDLLMVDEFQDTSPIQLELFLKLSRLARHSIWVGDPKQSIYGFRGADPRLMQAIIAQAGGVRPGDILGDSWRSREDIVYAVNALFTRAFAELPPEQVALHARRRKRTGPGAVNRADEPIEVDDALLHWHFRYDGEERRQPGKPWLDNCLADALRQLLDGRKYILPKGEKDYRPARPGDVAVLCRSNRECQEMAEALARAGLRVAIARAGLLYTAEARLVLACLKYILHRQDSLSVAEILLLAGGWPTEQIIEHRLDYLERAAGEAWPRPWAEDQPLIRRLDELREEVVELSSAEILDLLLEELDLRRTIVAWGNVTQRLDNVDVLRRMALQYEEACNRLHSAASLGGFLLWIGERHQRGEDAQGSGEGPDAVNVLTYHRSKGLEWPIVVCHSLERSLRAEVWGFDIVADRDAVDLDDVLGHRWLRYWVNPYDRQNRGTALDDRLAESSAQARATLLARQEEARLLYVGLTRARDYLIFPSSATPTRWLNRVWHGDEDTPTLLPDTHESPWEWNGHFLDIYTQSFPYPKDFPHADPPDAPLRFLEPRAGKTPYPPYFIDLREETLALAGHADATAQLQYGAGIAPADESERALAARLAREFLTAFHPGDSDGDLLALARGYLERYEAEAVLKPDRLIDLGRAFFRFLDQHFSPRLIHRGYFLRHQHLDRRFETTIDFVLDTPRGPVILQHARNPVEASRAKNEALRLAEYLFLCRQALRQLYDTPPARTLVHFPLTATLVEIDWSAGQD